MGSTDSAQAALDGSRLLFSVSDVAKAYDVLAEGVTAKLTGTNPVVVAVLTGGMVTAVELLKRLSFPCELDYVHATRYGDALQGGDLHWIKPPSPSLAGRHVLLVDDILDEGVTIKALRVRFQSVAVASLHTAVLLSKQSAVRDVDADFVGLQMQGGYVFGCGMDYRGYWRGLADIRVLED